MFSIGEELETLQLIVSSHNILKVLGAESQKKKLVSLVFRSQVESVVAVFVQVFSSRTMR